MTPVARDRVSMIPFFISFIFLYLLKRDLITKPRGVPFQRRMVTFNFAAVRRKSNATDVEKFAFFNCTEKHSKVHPRYLLINSDVACRPFEAK